MKKWRPPRPSKLPNSSLESKPEYVQAIGMVSIEISNLEIFLGEMLASLLHISPQFGRVIYLTPQSAFARLQILENVLHDSITPTHPSRSVIQDIIDRTRVVIGKRHEYTHGASNLAWKKMLLSRDELFAAKFHTAVSQQNR
jgi:hypothetical protein